VLELAADMAQIVAAAMGFGSSRWLCRHPTQHTAAEIRRAAPWNSL